MTWFVQRAGALEQKASLSEDLKQVLAMMCLKMIGGLDYSDSPDPVAWHAPPHKYNYAKSCDWSAW